MKKDLFVIYSTWRKELENLIAEGEKGSTDCGEAIVREDFSDYAGLKQEISFEEMLELEREYNRNI